jgi:acyl-CoA synthetase (AMP-forming)/AMP-acid ligase II
LALMPVTPAFETVVDLLRHRAEASPDQVGYRFLDYPGKGAPNVSR